VKKTDRADLDVPENDQGDKNLEGKARGQKGSRNPLKLWMTAPTRKISKFPSRNRGSSPEEV
jgi:hypothetical protein